MNIIQNTRFVSIIYDICGGFARRGFQNKYKVGSQSWRNPTFGGRGVTGKIFLSPRKFSRPAQTIFPLFKKVFITSFLTCVTNFVIHVTNFLICVTNFVIKTLLKSGRFVIACRKNCLRRA